MPQKDENLSQNDDLTAENLKNSGNEYFSLDKFPESVDSYSQALALKLDNKLRLTLLKNRAMARLKLEDFEGAESDCDEGLGFFLILGVGNFLDIIGDFCNYFFT